MIHARGKFRSKVNFHAKCVQYTLKISSFKSHKVSTSFAKWNLLTLMDFPESASLQHQKINLQISGLIKNNLTIFRAAINLCLSRKKALIWTSKVGLVYNKCLGGKARFQRHHLKESIIEFCTAYSHAWFKIRLALQFNLIPLKYWTDQKYFTNG